MFIIVSQRQEFTQTWKSLLAGRGNVVWYDPLSDLKKIINDSRPELVVADFHHPAFRAPEKIAALRQGGAKTRILLGSTQCDAQKELAFLAAGVVGCCDERLRPEDLAKVIGVVLHDGIWVSPAAIPLLINRLHSSAAKLAAESRAEAPASGNLALLSPREREVARMVGKGASNRDIASAMNITDRTVKAHLSAIFAKLGVSDRLQLALRVRGEQKAAATTYPA